MRCTRGAWLLVAMSWCPAAVGADVHDARGEAFRLYDAGRYAEALPLLDRVLAAKPRDLDSLNRRGAIRLRSNQPALALADLDAAVRVSPFLAFDAAGLARQYAPDVQGYRPTVASAALQADPAAVTNRGIALVMLGRDEEAVAEFRRAVAIRSTYPQPFRRGWREGLACAYCGIGRVAYLKGEYGQAVDAFRTATENAPGDPNGYAGLGDAEAGLGRFEDAVRDYNEALRLDPTHAHALGARASVLVKTGRTDAALADYDAALRADPGLTTVRRLRAALLASLGRSDRAAEDLTEAVRLAPGDAGARKDRGGVLNQAGDYADALKDLDEAVRLDPTSSRAFQNRAASYNGLGRYEDALRDAEEAVRLDPKNAGARNNRGLARIGLGRYDQAVSDLTEAIRLLPGMACAHLNRGGAYAQLGRYDEAATDYAEAIHLDPRLAGVISGSNGVPGLVRVAAKPSGDDLALRNGSTAARLACDRGNVYRSSGDWPAAIAAYTEAVDADPKAADGYALRGWARLCSGVRGADADARAWFGVAGWRDPFAPYMAMLGALAARGDGRDLAASAFLDEALANTPPTKWPAPVFRYLKGGASADDLVAAASGPEPRTLARAVIGLERLRLGDASGAADHLRRAVDEGAGRSIARDLAREALRRAEGVGRGGATER